MKPWYFIQNPLQLPYLDSGYIQNLSIFTTQDIQNSRESLKYRALFNLEIFTTLVYLSPSIVRIREILKTLSNMHDVPFPTETLCNTGIIRTQDIFRTLQNIYYGEFYSEHYITLKYLEPWHI